MKMITQGGAPGEGGPFGQRMELMGFEGMHGGKVVTGAPFRAVAVSETTQSLPDGNNITRKSQTTIYRDSQGRFRQEVTFSGWIARWFGNSADHRRDSGPGSASCTFA